MILFLAILMIIAWMLFAPTGILIARYFKFIFQKLTLFNTQIWFLIHFPLMASVVIISIVAFLIILSNANWQWVSLKSDPVFIFVHSIFGILAISLAFIQVCDIRLLWLIKCLKLDSYLFNLIAFFSNI